MNYQPTTPTDSAQPLVVAGVLAEFDRPETLLAAAAQLRDAGFTRWDAHSPYALHGIDRAMGIRPTRLPSARVGRRSVRRPRRALMQWWMNAVNYPVNVSGKPLFSLPANIPITFELIVLLQRVRGLRRRARLEPPAAVLALGLRRRGLSARYQRRILHLDRRHRSQVRPG